MTALAPTLPDLDQLPRWERLMLEAEFERLHPLPSGPLPVLDRWTLDWGAIGLLTATGVLEGDADPMTVQVLRVAPERPAVWLMGAHWSQLGSPAHDADGDELAALLKAGARWCEVLCRELGRDQ